MFIVIVASLNGNQRQGIELAQTGTFPKRPFSMLCKCIIMVKMCFHWYLWLLQANLYNKYQGILTDGEGVVQLTSSLR
jgi:hypothetical protein